MSKSAYFYGIIIGGATVGTAYLLTTPESRTNYEYELQLFRDKVTQQWNDLKEDIAELISIGQELKNKAIVYLEERVPKLMERISTFKESLSSNFSHIRASLSELESTLAKMWDDLNSYNKQ